MSIKKTLLTTAVGLGLTAGMATAEELTIAIVNNGHMINMQTVAEAYTAETGVELNWVSLHHQHRYARSTNLGRCWLDRSS